ncbi:hypothetical protein KSS87_003309 [Heliosperma pusillum]|nr:hypothetical protein KSS87_003309 [Heliosperma pusillum]
MDTDHSDQKPEPRKPRFKPKRQPPRVIKRVAPKIEATDDVESAEGRELMRRFQWRLTKLPSAMAQLCLGIITVEVFQATMKVWFLKGDITLIVSVFVLFFEPYVREPLVTQIKIVFSTTRKITKSHGVITAIIPQQYLFGGLILEIQVCQGLLLILFASDYGQYSVGDLGLSPQNHLTRRNLVESPPLMKDENSDPRMLLFQIPRTMPMTKRVTSAAVEASASNLKPANDDRPCKLNDLKAGLMGKLLVYKSGAVKLKLGDTAYDVTPGSDCGFAQDVVDINAQKKHLCVTGEISKHVILTPDVDSILDSFADLG